MKRKRLVTFRHALILTGILLAVAAAVPAGEKDNQRIRYSNRPDSLFPYHKVTVYKDVYIKRPEFLGAGRELPEPDVEAVRIGFIGPLLESDGPIIPPGFRVDPSVAPKAVFGRRLLRGAVLAVEEANASGGYRGKPFEIVRRTDLVQWGQTSNELAKFAYDDKVWAILSGIDSNHSHVLNRTTLKAEVPLVNAGSSDPTLTEHSIPWLIRCMSDDRLNSYELLNYISRVRKFTRIAVLRVNDRDGRVGVLEFVNGARRLGIPVRLELRFENGDTDFRDKLENIRQLDPEVVVLWAGPREAGLIVRQMRALGMKQQIVGFDRMTDALFLEQAGEAAEGAVIAASLNPLRADKGWTDFKRRFQERWGEAPDTYAAHGYDGMNLVVWAVREAGLNRALIRDALYSLSGFDGVTGRIVFDENMNDIGRPWLAEVQNGRLKYFQPEDWERRLQLQVTVPSRTSP